MATQAPISEIKGLRFLPRDKVWFFYNNKPTEAPIWEVRITKNETIDFYIAAGEIDGKIDNSRSKGKEVFQINVCELFATKELLINSL